MTVPPDRLAVIAANRNRKGQLRRERRRAMSKHAFAALSAYALMDEQLNRFRDIRELVEYGGNAGQLKAAILSKLSLIDYPAKRREVQKLWERARTAGARSLHEPSA